MFNFFHQSHGDNGAADAVASSTYGVEIQSGTPPVAQRTRQQTANANLRLGFSEPREIKRRLLDEANDTEIASMAYSEHYASVPTASGPPAPKSPKADAKRVPRQFAKRAAANTSSNCMAIMEEDESTLTGRVHSTQAAAAAGLNSPVRSARQQAMLESTRRVLLEAEVDSCTMTDSTSAAAGLSSPSRATGGAHHTELTMDLRRFGIDSGTTSSSLLEQLSPSGGGTSSGGRVTRSLAASLQGSHKTSIAASPNKAKSPAKGTASIAFPAVSLGFSRSYASSLVGRPAAASDPTPGHLNSAASSYSKSSNSGEGVSVNLRSRPSQNLITKYATVASTTSGKRATANK